MKINPTILLLQSSKGQLYFHSWLFYLPFSITNRSSQIPAKPPLDHNHQSPQLLVEIRIQFNLCVPLQLPFCFPLTTCFTNTHHCPHHLQISVLCQSFSSEHQLDLLSRKIYWWNLFLLDPFLLPCVLNRYSSNQFNILVVL